MSNDEITLDDIDESPDDLSVYQLAEKVAAGRVLTEQANHEIAAELQRLSMAVADVYNDDSRYFCETVQQEAQALLDLRAKIEAILNPLAAATPTAP